MRATLLASLTKALNSLYGNTILEDEVEMDLIECPKCHCTVTEDKFNHKMNQCYPCWYGDND